MAARAFYRGHPLIVIHGQWVYKDTHEKAPVEGGIPRPCKKCGKVGENGVDACLGILPGVRNACCGHGDPSKAFVQFTNNIVLRGFTIETL